MSLPSSLIETIDSRSIKDKNSSRDPFTTLLEKGSNKQNQLNGNNNGILNGIPSIIPPSSPSNVYGLNHLMLQSPSVLGIDGNKSQQQFILPNSIDIITNSNLKENEKPPSTLPSTSTPVQTTLSSLPWDLSSISHSLYLTANANKIKTSFFFKIT
jgi:hypothetical protein